MLRSFDWYLVVDIVGQPVGPNIKGRLNTTGPLKIAEPMFCPETSVTETQRCVTSQRAKTSLRPRRKAEMTSNFLIEYLCFL